MSKVLMTWTNVTLNQLDDGSFTIVNEDGSTSILESSKLGDNLVINEDTFIKYFLIGMCGYIFRGILDTFKLKKENKIKRFGECVKTTLLP